VDDRVWADMLDEGSNDAGELADEEDAVHVGLTCSQRSAALG
jgi:hypothetical protein